MKQRIVALILVALLAVVYQKVNGQVFQGKTEIGSFSRLIVKSNLKVVLVESDIVDTVRIEGSKNFLESIMILQSGEELIVRSKSFRDMKKDGTIYIPVRDLKHLEVNSDAKIISYTIIKSPELNVVVNGDCVVSLVLNGKLNIHEADGYKASFRRVYHQSNTPIYLGNFYNN